MDSLELYRGLYLRREIQGSSSDFELPTLHMILLYVEWVIQPCTIQAVATHVTTEVMRRKLKNNSKFIEEFNKILDGSAFTEEFRRIVGSDAYDYACSAIGDGENAIPLGLAPTLHMFCDFCKTCGVPRYIRSFCLRCGSIHDVSVSVTYSGLSKRGKQMVYGKSGSNHIIAKKSVSISTSTSFVSVVQAMTSESARNDTIPSTISGKAVSMQKLLALHRQKMALQSTTPYSDEGILAIEVVKRQPVIIDLISDDDDDDDDDSPVWISDNLPRASPAARCSPAGRSYDNAATAEIVVKSEPSRPTNTTTTTSIAHLTVKQEVVAHDEMEPSESSSDITAAESADLNGEAMDPDQVPMKLEWPARRMNTYEMAAMRGIAALYKYGQSNVNPGDMLFLMRNLATNCSGLHRIAARCGFKKLCTQWAAEHKTHHSNDTECDVLDVIEGAFTLAQLINPGNRSWGMYQETDNQYADSDSTTATTHATGASHQSSSSAAAPPPDATVWENAEGRLESEYDFATRIDFALSCSNLKFMIYSLTGDRHYHSLKSEPGEDICVAMELIGDTMLDCNTTKKQRLDALRSVSSGVAVSSAIGSSGGTVAATSTAAVTVSAAALAMTNAVGFRPELTNHAMQRKTSTASLHESHYHSRRRSNHARDTKRQLFENLSEEFGSSDKFGNVSPEVGEQFMEYASVLAACKVFLKENLKYVALADFIGIELDKFESPDAGCMPDHAVQHGAKSGASSKSAQESGSCGGHGSGSSKQRGGKRPHKDNLIDSNLTGRETFTGALCWPYITEEVGFDADLRIDKTLVDYRVKHSTLSKAVAKLATVRVYHSIAHFTRSGAFDREGYKQQCYFVTHVVYAFSDWGQHPLRRQLFAEEFQFLVTNAAAIIEVLKDAELVGEVLHCLRILQYAAERDPGLVALFEDGMNFLLKVEKDYGCMGRWVATRSTKKEDIYTQYHASYCAVVGLAEPPYSKNEKLLLNPPVSQLIRRLQSADEPQYLL